MSVIDTLSTRPSARPPALHVVRCHDQLVFISLSNAPLFLASHWRNGRSFPCSADLIGECRFCSPCPRRVHAYLAGMIASGNGQSWFKGAVELSPEPLLRLMDESGVADLLGHCLALDRQHKRGSVQVSFRKEQRRPNLSAIGHMEILRTLTRLYALPEPDDYLTEEAWLLAVRIRVMAPDYTPARSVRSPNND